MAYAGDICSDLRDPGHTVSKSWRMLLAVIPRTHSGGAYGGFSSLATRVRKTYILSVRRGRSWTSHRAIEATGLSKDSPWMPRADIKDACLPDPATDPSLDSHRRNIKKNEATTLTPAS